ncbi:hypothetical protein JD844_022305 [Phrynosoma platyrhinos]|uniref:AN1-type domain-containing protein n=1 Tax=Phrynosoma platyrhinos TaxID=52577 RepID=A0ABQ7SVC1_PHRPL|nr:hypothetical protein JD844_022305 [Phrynosoma platyrhinos]
MPDIIVGAHIDQDCKSDPAQRKRKIFTNKCQRPGCKQREMMKVLCDQCHGNFCLKHRHPLDHECSGTAGHSLSKAGNAAITRAQKSAKASSNTTSNNGAMSSATSLPTSSRVTEMARAPQPQSTLSPAVALQNGLTEEEALQRALEMSLAEVVPSQPQPRSYECLTPAQRNHCENQLKRRPGHGKGRSRRSSERVRREEAPVGLCEIHFLPTVVATQDPKHLQKLHCMGLPFTGKEGLDVFLTEAIPSKHLIEEQQVLGMVRADPKERYPITELLADLENCNARRVLLFLDQSYPGPLAKKLQASRRHPNVVLVRSTGATTAPGALFPDTPKVSGLPDFKKLSGKLSKDCPNCCKNTPKYSNWALFTLCNTPIKKGGTKDNMAQMVGPWSAVLASGVPGQLLNVTLAGAPCHSVPPLGEEERQRRYQGCQNLPTMLWYQSRHQQLPQEDE